MHTQTIETKNIGGKVCPQCGEPMLLHFAKKPFRPIIACADCGTFIADDGTIKTCVGEFTVDGRSSDNAKAKRVDSINRPSPI